MKKRIAKITVLLLCGIICMSAIWSALSFKYGDGILGMKYLYQQQENSVDVLVLGSSHAFEDVNTEILYDEYGIAAYVLAGSVQPLWNTYYYLKEALKTQKPKLVVIEGFMTSQDFEYSDNSRIIKNCLGIRDIRNRIDALKVSVPEGQIMDYLLDYRLWHSRYTELGADDFRQYYDVPKYRYYKGFGMNFDMNSQEEPDVDKAAYQKSKPVIAKEEEYYRKTVELCQEQKIPVMTVISPYPLSAEEQQKHNYLKKVSDEYGISFVNFNSSDFYRRMELDFNSDFSDSDHLNYQGNEKYTRVLAGYMLEEAELPDRRGDPAYTSWAMHSKDVEERKRDEIQIRTMTDVSELTSELVTADDLSLLIYPLNQTVELEASAGLFKKAGMKPGDIQDGQLYHYRDGAITRLSDGTQNWKESDTRYARLINFTSSEGDGTNTTARASIKVNNQEYISDQTGWYVLIQNEYTGNFVGVTHIALGADGTIQCTWE